MHHITLNLDARQPLGTPQWIELDQRFRTLDHTVSANQPALMALVRELVESLHAPAHSRVLQLAESPSTRVYIFADFHCDEDGDITNDNHLSLSVMLGRAPLIMDSGINDVRDLPLAPDTAALGVVVVLAAVVDYINALIRRAIEAFSTTEPEMAIERIPAAAGHRR